MPQWRKLHTKTVNSLDVNDMPDDFTRLLWVLLPLKLDRCGRGLDNPTWVRSKVMPLREDVTTQMVSDAMDWYAKREMIERYRVNGRSYFWIPTWHQYQGKTDREAESEFPPPDSYDDNSRVSQESVLTNSRPDSDIDADADSYYADADASASVAKEKESALAPDTPESRKLFARLAANANAKGWRAPKQFKSLEQKRKFDETALTLGDGLDALIVRALEQERVSIRAVVNYVAKCAENDRKANEPRVIRVGQ
jgi:hypothetical protein